MTGALDIGGTNIVAAMVDDAGRIAARVEAPTAPVRGDGAAGLRKVVELLDACARQAGGAPAGIGVSCTGPVDPFTGRLGAVDFLPGWAGLNLVEELARAFKAPVALENDADAAALAESAWGAGRGRKRFLYVTVSTGIGGGLVLDGKLYRGACGMHPEIGHHVLDASGPPCSCGARGCWEALASGPAMAAWYRGQDAAAADVDARWICDMARQGHELACRAVERESLYLGMGLANMVNLLAPDSIALGGGVMRSWPLFEQRCREVIRAHCVFVPSSNTEVTPALLGSDVGVLGAARVWHNRFSSPESGKPDTPAARLS